MKSAFIVVACVFALMTAESAQAKKKKFATVGDAKKACIAEDHAITGTALSECIKKKRQHKK